MGIDSDSSSPELLLSLPEFIGTLTVYEAQGQEWEVFV